MFNLNDVANAIKLAATTAFVEQSFTFGIANGATPDNTEIPAFDFTLTEDEQTGGYSLSTPRLPEARPFTLDNSQSLYSPENLLKVVGAGIAVYASYHLEELNQQMEAESLRIAQEAGH
ncbi:TPA: hypothetical protein ACXEZB_004386 [Escherichia coli]